MMKENSMTRNVRGLRGFRVFAMNSTGILLVLTNLVTGSGCGVQLSTSVERGEFSKPYTRPLFVLQHNNQLKGFSSDLEYSLKAKFMTQNKIVKIMQTNEGGEIALYSKGPTAGKINALIASDSIDIVIFFRPTELQSSLASNLTYLILATDVRKQVNVWRGHSQSSMNSNGAVKLTAKVHEKLLADRVL
jgi:hypothetical protein